jgi:hypothetical protein
MTRQGRDQPRSLRRRLLRLVVAAIEEYGRGIAVTAPVERRSS